MFDILEFKEHLEAHKFDPDYYEHNSESNELVCVFEEIYGGFYIEFVLSFTCTKTNYSPATTLQPEEYEAVFTPTSINDLVVYFGTEPIEDAAPFEDEFYFIINQKLL